MQLKSLLEKMIEVHASDVFIIAGLPLAYQAGGSHVRTDTPPLTPADTQEYIETVYKLAGRDLSLFTDSVNHDDDFSFAVPSVGRFRANIFRQRGSYGAVIRVIPFGLPDPDEMNIPESVMRLADLNRGLVLVTGPTGCGKSTTLACMLDRMNHKRTGHILTMEDPIEFVHKHGSCIITQRNIPTDIANYSEALRSAMRESPDVILLGEMRDAETIGTAINAAEMTQLVLSTLHTTSAADTIEIDRCICNSILMSLELLRICTPQCKGLCPVCGVNRNQVSCSCSQSKPEKDNPFSVLQGLLNNEEV